MHMHAEEEGELMKFPGGPLLEQHASGPIVENFLLSSDKKIWHDLRKEDFLNDTVQLNAST